MENLVKYCLWSWSPEVIPSLNKLSSNKKWVMYGEDNLLPEKLIDLYSSSPTNAGILNKKSNFIAGQGVELSSKEAESFANKLDDGEGLHSLIKKMSMDYVVFGGYYIQCISNPEYNLLNSFLHQPYSTVRVGYADTKNDNDKYDKGIWLSNNWRRYTLNQNKPSFYKDFSFKDTNSTYSFLFSKRYSLDYQYYPLPEYYSSLRSIQTEIELINFMYNNTVNSFVPSGILKMPVAARPSNEEELSNMIKSGLSGTNNAGKIFTVFADGDKTVEWMPVNNHFAEKDVKGYLDTVIQNIILSHSLPSPTIIGLPGGASLSGDGNTIIAATKEFFNSLKESQNKIIKDLEKLFSKAGYPTTITIIQNDAMNEQSTQTQN